MAEKSQMDKHLQNSTFGAPKVNPDEQRRYLGTFRERVSLAINKHHAAMNKRCLGRLQKRHHGGDFIRATGTAQRRNKIAGCLTKPGIVQGCLV